MKFKILNIFSNDKKLNKKRKKESILVDLRNNNQFKNENKNDNNYNKNNNNKNNKNNINNNDLNKNKDTLSSSSNYTTISSNYTTSTISSNCSSKISYNSLCNNTCNKNTYINNGNKRSNNDENDYNINNKKFARVGTSFDLKSFFQSNEDLDLYLDYCNDEDYKNDFSKTKIIDFNETNFYRSSSSLFRSTISKNSNYYYENNNQYSLSSVFISCFDTYNPKKYPYQTK
ncbi:hypothetical protein ACTFIZ_005152 [Dictyostelium cf. discoideum]